MLSEERVGILAMMARENAPAAIRLAARESALAMVERIETFFAPSSEPADISARECGRMIADALRAELERGDAAPPTDYKPDPKWTPYDNGMDDKGGDYR